MKLLCVGIVLLGVSYFAGADFALYGTEHLDVITSHATGVLWDSSTADILEGGYANKVYINDDATLNVLEYRYGTSGENIRYAYAYNNSTVIVSGGQIGTKDFDGIYTYDASNAIISGGSINCLIARDTSNLNVSGGIVSELTTMGESTVVVYGGQFGTKLFNTFQVRETSSATISGGSIHGLVAYDTSQVDISGGSVGGILVYPPNYVVGDGLRSYNSSHVNISGGNIKRLNAYDASHITVSDGNIESFNARNLRLDGPERINITGGIVENLNAYIVLDGNGYLSYIDDFLPSDLISYGVHIAGVTVNLISSFTIYDTSRLDVSGGNISNIIAYDSSTLNVSSGSIQTIYTYNTSNANIFRCGDMSHLNVHNSSAALIYGYDFHASGGASIIDNEVVGSGLLRGKWFDGNFFTIHIGTNAPAAVILLISEPPTSPDLTSDGVVNYKDFELFARWWLQDCGVFNDWCEGVDFGLSGSVDISDLMLLTAYWMDGWVVVPDVAALSQADAELSIVEAGLFVGAITEEYSDTVELGHIISQSPYEGQIVLPNTEVDIVVSLGPMAFVPNVVGMPLIDAETAIVVAGLSVGDVTEEFSDAVIEGNIISQSPIGSHRVPPDTTVDVVVSKGPSSVVPDVVGMSQADAELAVGEAGLIVGTITEGYSDTIDDDHVIAQNPADEEVVALGSIVDLVVSAPKPSITWVAINDPGVSGHEGFSGHMSVYETTNAQFAQYLNDALASGDIEVSGSYIKGAEGSNDGQDFINENYYTLDGQGATSFGATNGGKSRISYSGGTFTVDSGFENHPVTYISWYGATAFASYYGWRLPTEWEWQAVADYDGSYTYATGDSLYDSEKFLANYRANGHDGYVPDDLPYHPWVVHGTSEVGYFGTFGYGLADMSGNVFEWTSSVGGWGSQRVFRGGFWGHGGLGDSGSGCAVSLEYGFSPYDMNYYVGFRVCR